MRRYILLGICLLLCGLARADVVVLQGQGNSPTPVNKIDARLTPVEEPQIAMESEVVDIAEYRDEARGARGTWVTCIFRMKSYAGQPISRLMAFPVVNPAYQSYLQRDFVVEVNGKPAEISYYDNLKGLSDEERQQWRTDYQAMQYPGYFTWPVSWQPGETKAILCRYDMGERERYFNGGPVEGWQLRYIVRTGALWRGTIGKADITMTFIEDPRLDPRVEAEGEKEPTLNVTYSRQSRWTSPRQIRWHFEDWEPTDDILTKSVRWTGFTNHYQFPLTDRYGGAQRNYTAELLDGLVDRELTPWKAVFPLEVRMCDRQAVRARIAEALYYEIYARHGDPFVTGKIGDPRPADVSMEGADGYYYGKWRAFFQKFSYHGGWYQPDIKKKLKVSADELNAMERTNLLFLKEIFQGT